MRHILLTCCAALALVGCAGRSPEGAMKTTPNRRKALGAAAAVCGVFLAATAYAIQDDDGGGKADPSKNGSASSGGAAERAQRDIQNYGWEQALRIAATRARIKSQIIELQRERDEIQRELDRRDWSRNNTDRPSRNSGSLADSHSRQQREYNDR